MSLVRDLCFSVSRPFADSLFSIGRLNIDHSSAFTFSNGAGDPNRTWTRAARKLSATNADCRRAAAPRSRCRTGPSVNASNAWRPQTAQSATSVPVGTQHSSSAK
eukprot:Selendium_serpulae@DN5374_c0_g1_i3.p3